MGSLNAGIAQLVEQLIRNEQVACSSHVSSSTLGGRISMMSKERIETIVATFVSTQFLYNTIIDLDDNYCITYNGKGVGYIERTFDEFVDIADELMHPLFKGKLKNELTRPYLKTAFDNKQTLRVEALMMGFDDHQFHWFRIRLVPIDDGSGHTVFFFNVLLIDDDIRKSEENRAEVFNKAVLEQLIYNYILVYVIDLSNSMSRLVYSNTGDDYDVYARQFSSHLEMMNDVCENFISEDFQASFARFMDYAGIKEQLDEGKDRMVLIFRDKRGTAFEMTVSKYPEYAPDYPLVVFSLKELN